MTDEDLDREGAAALGAGTDFCLFLISRYKEELERGATHGAAVTEAVGRVGEVYSALPLSRGAGLITTLTRAQAVAQIPPDKEGLARGEDVRAHLDARLEGQTKEMNSLTEQIKDLNRRIKQQELSGAPANDLRDQRDMATRKLSAYVDVSVHTDDQGSYNVDIKGVDAQGRRYHALNPDVFYWAHSTFFVGTIIVADRLCGGITEDEKRQLFEEHVQWYSMYGMSMRPVPKTWEEFQVYWEHMCTEVLENNTAARDVLDLRELPKPPFVDWMPEWMWRANRAVVARFFVWFTVGLYDPPVRKLMGYSWSGRDEWLHRRFGEAVNLVFRALPRRSRCKWW